MAARCPGSGCERRPCGAASVSRSGRTSTTGVLRGACASSSEQPAAARSRPASSVVPLMREAVKNWTPSVAPEEIGTVVTAGDEIATVSGLENVRSTARSCVFPGGIKGMVQDLRRDEVGCVLFGDSRRSRGGQHRPPQREAPPVCRWARRFLGRVVDALGQPIDGKGDIQRRGLPPHRGRRPRHPRPPAGQHPDGDRPSVDRRHVPHRPGPA